MTLDHYGVRDKPKHAKRRAPLQSITYHGAISRWNELVEMRETIEYSEGHLIGELLRRRHRNDTGAQALPNPKVSCLEDDRISRLELSADHAGRDRPLVCKGCGLAMHVNIAREVKAALLTRPYKRLDR